MTSRVTSSTCLLALPLLLLTSCAGEIDAWQSRFRGECVPVSEAFDPVEEVTSPDGFPFYCGSIWASPGACGFGGSDATVQRGTSGRYQVTYLGLDSELKQPGPNSGDCSTGIGVWAKEPLEDLWQEEVFFRGKAVPPE